jgi:GH24 family phage-related lysozyme (muramidase)
MLNHKLIEKIGEIPFEESSSDEQKKALNSKYFDFIYGGENFRSIPYFDTVNVQNPTIGHGISIKHHSDKLFKEMNITDKKHQDEYLKILEDTKKDFKDAIDKIDNNLKNKSNEALLDNLNYKYKEFNQSNSTLSSNNTTSIPNNAIQPNTSIDLNSINSSIASNQSNSTLNSNVSNQSNSTIDSNTTNKNSTIQTSNLEFFTTPSVDIKKENIEAELQKVGITDKEQIKEYKSIWEQEMDTFNAEIKSEVHKETKNNERKNYNSILQTALNEKYAELNPDAKNKKFEISDTQSQNIFNEITKGSQSKLDNILKVGKEDEILPKNSKEYAALLDLAYNGGDGIIKTPNKSDKDLADILNEDNRAEAWYKIRYELNGGISRDDLASRRVSESNEFGLYEKDKDNISFDEAKNILSMYNAHKDKITNEEKAFPLSYKNSNSIKNQLEPVLKYLQKTVKEDTDKDIKLTLDNIMASSKDDVILGKHESINAKEGNDIIYASNETKTATGGKGDDTYIYDGKSDLTINDMGDFKDKDTLILKGVNLENTEFKRDDDKLTMTFKDKEGSINIKDYQDKGKIESFKFDDKEISYEQLNKLMTENENNEKIKNISLADLILEDLNKNRETKMTKEELINKAFSPENQQALQEAVRIYEQSQTAKISNQNNENDNVITHTRQ